MNMPKVHHLILQPPYRKWLPQRVRARMIGLSCAWLPVSRYRATWLPVTQLGAVMGFKGIAVAFNRIFVMVGGR